MMDIEKLQNNDDVVKMQEVLVKEIEDLEITEKKKEEQKKEEQKKENTNKNENKHENKNVIGNKSAFIQNKDFNMKPEIRQKMVQLIDSMLADLDQSKQQYLASRFAKTYENSENFEILLLQHKAFLLDEEYLKFIKLFVNKNPNDIRYCFWKSRTENVRIINVKRFCNLLKLIVSSLDFTVKAVLAKREQINKMLTENIKQTTKIIEEETNEDEQNSIFG